MISAYKIGITVTLANHASGVLNQLVRDFAKSNAQAQQLHSTIKSIGLLTAGGFVSATLGLHLLGMFKGPYEEAKKYEMALTRLKVIGLKPADILDADQFATKTRVMGVSATELLNQIRDLHTVMGDYDQAKALAPSFARMQYVNQALFGEAGNKVNSHEMAQLARVIEMRGGFHSEAAMREQMNFMQKSLSATGGMVLPTQFRNFVTTGGTAAQLMSNHAFYAAMEPIIQEMGGFRTGTGLMTAFNRVILGVGSGGATGKVMRQHMEMLGLINKGDTEINPTTGLVTSVKPGSLKGRDQYIEDPHRWLMDVMVPAMAAKGITKDADIGRELGLIFGRTGGNVFLQMYRQRDKIAKNMRTFEGADDLDAAGKKVDNSPAGAEAQLHAAWKNLMTAIGRTYIPIIVPALRSLAEGINFLADAAVRNPFAVKMVVGSLAALGVALVGLGGLAIVVAGFKALGVIFTLGGVTPAIMSGVAAGFTAVAGALGLSAFGLLGGIAIGLTALGGAVALFSWLYSHEKKLNEEHPETDSQYRDRVDASRITAAGRTRRRGTYHPDLDAGPVGAMSTPPAGGFGPRAAQVTGTVMLDNRKVGDIISEHLSARAAMPPGGVGGYDGRMSYTPPGTR